MSEWISVKERLPELGVQVLVAYDLNLDDAEYDEDYEPWYTYGTWKRSSDDTKEIIRLNLLTHWMPMPPPPETD